MENRRPVTDTRRDGEAALFAAYWRWKDARSGEIDEGTNAEPEHFEAIATGWAPEGESALLVELVEQGTGLAGNLAESVEMLPSPNHLAVANAYRHRLQALRCEYGEARLRTMEAEEQLHAAHVRIAHLDAELRQIYASCWWKVKERMARCWNLVLRCLGRPERLRPDTGLPPV